MAIDLLRTTQILSGADALLPTQTDTILHAVSPGAAGAANPLSGALEAVTSSSDGSGLAAAANDAVGAIQSQQLGAGAGGNGIEGAISGLTGTTQANGLGHAVGGLATAVPAPSTAPLTSFANNTVGTIHAVLEGSSDVGGLPGTVHAVTNLGETVGLGKIGDPNLVTDVANTPQSLLSGDTSTLAHVPTDLGNIVTAANPLYGLSSDVASGQFLSDPVGHTVGLATGLATLPVGAIAGNAVQAVSATIGGSVGALASDLGHVVGDLGVLLDPVAGLGHAVGGLATAVPAPSTAPLTSFANNTVGTIHAVLEGSSDVGGLPGTVHAVTNLGETVGLGKIGDPNLVTDVANTPQSLLSGDTSTLAHVPTDLGNIVTAANPLYGLSSDLASGQFVSDPIGHTVGLATGLATLPVGAIAGNAVQAGLATIGGPIGALVGDLTHGAGDLGTLLDPVAGPVESVGASVLTGATSALGVASLGPELVATFNHGILETIEHVPGAVLSGQGLGVGAVPGEITGTLGSAGTVVGTLAGGLSHGGGDLGTVLDPVTSPVEAVGESVLNGATSALGVGNVGPALVDTFDHGILNTVEQVPGAILSGQGLGLGAVPGEGTGTLGSAGAAIGTLASDLAHGAGGLESTIAGLAGGATGVASGLTSAAADTLGSTGATAATIVHQVADDLGATGATAGHIVGEIGDTLGATTATAATIVGEVGDTLGTTAATAAGVVGGIGPTLGAAGSELTGLAGTGGSGVVDTASHVVGDAVGTVGSTVSGLAGGASGIGSGLVDTATHAVGDAAGTIGTVASGVTGGGLGTGLADTATHAVGTVASTVSGLAGSGLGSGLADTATHAVGDAAGTVSGLASGLGGAGGLGSTLGGVVGGATGGSAAHDIATISLGPQTTVSGLGLNVLSNGGGTPHVVDVHVGSAGTAIPTIANVAILPDTIHVPAATGGGFDALTGIASAIPSAAASGSGAAASAAHGLDLGIAHVDVPVAAHAEPLHALAHAV